MKGGVIDRNEPKPVHCISFLKGPLKGFALKSSLNIVIPLPGGGGGSLQTPNPRRSLCVKFSPLLCLGFIIWRGGGVVSRHFKNIKAFLLPSELKEIFIK